MQLRRYAFKEVPIIEETPDGKNVQRGIFDYYTTAREIITNAPGQNGIQTEELLTAMAIFSKFKAAKNTKADFVWLEEDEYVFFVNRLNAFRWVKAHEVVVDFINYVRTLKLEDVTIRPSATATD